MSKIKVKTLKRGPEYFRDKQREISQTRSEKRYGIRGLVIPENTVTIVLDPDPVGFFAPGSKINGFAECLSHGSITPGTIIEYHDKQYRVNGTYKQTLEAVE